MDLEIRSQYYNDGSRQVGVHLLRHSVSWRDGDALSAGKSKGQTMV